MVTSAHAQGTITAIVFGYCQCKVHLGLNQSSEGHYTFIAEESECAIRNASDLGSYPPREHIEGSPGMCEVLVPQEGPLVLIPAILVIRIYWSILHAANVICGIRRACWSVGVQSKCWQSYTQDILGNHVDI